MKQYLDYVGLGIIVVVLVILAVQIVRSFAGAIDPVPSSLDSWTKWTAAMVALGVAIRGVAKGFRSLL